MVIMTQILPQNDTVWVFKPKDYRDIRNYPVVYMLHGWSGNYKQWNQITNLQQYADDNGFIIVCPDGLYDSWYVDSPIKPNQKWETFFLDNLMPEVKQKYNVNDSAIFITGLSMGGHGALLMFLKHQKLFKSAGSCSGVVDLRVAAKGDVGVKQTFGELKQNAKTYSEFSVIDNINSLVRSNKQIIFDCGTEDHLYGINNELRKKCDELKIKATYISSPGEHNYEYWKKAIHLQMEFFKQQIGR